MPAANITFTIANVGSVAKKMRNPQRGKLQIEMIQTRRRNTLRNLLMLLLIQLRKATYQRCIPATAHTLNRLTHQ